MNLLYAAVLIGSGALTFAAPEDHDANASDLERCTITDLANLLDAVERIPRLPERTKLAAKYDGILVELIRRDNPKAEGLLRGKLKARTSKNELWDNEKARLRRRARGGEFDEVEPLVDVRQWLFQVETLTALRRVQHKRDPVTITVAESDGLTATLKHLPTLSILLKSADVERVPVWLKMPNANRRERPGNWRIDVKDSEGRAVPVRPNSEKFKREDKVTAQSEDLTSVREDWCEYGASLAHRVPMDDYVEITKPAEYTVTVLYHNTVAIADIQDPKKLDNLIVFRSKPFNLIVAERLPTEK